MRHHISQKFSQYFFKSKCNVYINNNPLKLLNQEDAHTTYIKLTLQEEDGVI